MMRGLSGFLPIRNGESLDYCWREAALSLLPVCDELILCDSDSTDGTREAMDEWASREPKLRVINYPWPDPVGDPRMLIKWLNWIRGHCRYDMQITCDADEVLCPKSYDIVRLCTQSSQPLWFRRLHFWKDAQHLVPEGQVCGTYVARLGPTWMEMVSDEPRPEGEPPIRQLAMHHPDARFFHYGFLRKQDAFIAKSRVMQRALHNTFDPRLQNSVDTGVHWTDGTDKGVSSTCFPLVEYDRGDHPSLMNSWLRERGYET